MSDDYEDILNMSWDEIPEEKALPVGSWRLRGRNSAHLAAKGDTSERVLFVYTAQEPLDDVDEEALGALGPDYEFSENQIFATFWCERKADWRKVEAHLQKHGIETEGQNVGESLKEFGGQEVIAYLNQKTFTNNMGELETKNEPSGFQEVD